MKADEFLERVEGIKEGRLEDKQPKSFKKLLATSSDLPNNIKRLKNGLRPAEKEFLEYMSKNLPPVIGRAEVHKLLPGLVSTQTLAQADSAGLGPEGAWRIGRKVFYKTENLLLWLVGRMGVTRLIDVNKYSKAS